MSLPRVNLLIPSGQHVHGDFLLSVEDKEMCILEHMPHELYVSFRPQEFGFQLRGNCFELQVPGPTARSVMMAIVVVIVVVMVVVGMLGLCMHGDMFYVLHHLVNACLLEVVGLVELHLVSL